MDKVKCFIIDVKYGEEPVKTYLFSYEDQQDQAQAFCADVRANRGLVNIRIRNVNVPN